MDSNNNRNIYRASTEEVSALSKRPGKRSVFRLDSSAYYRAKKTQDAALHAKANESAFSAREPDDLVSPEIASHLTTEIPIGQIFAGLTNQQKAKNAIENFPYDLGGHMTQTIEIPVIDSAIIKAADTKFGLFVEFEEQTSGNDRQDTDCLADRAVPEKTGSNETVYMSAATYFSQQAAQTDREPSAAVFAEPAHDLPDESEPEQEEAVYNAVRHRYITVRAAQPKYTIPPIIRKLFPPRLLAFLIAFVILFTPLGVLASVYNVVYVHEDGSRVHTVITRETQVEAILDKAGLTLRPTDIYESEQIGNTINVMVNRSYPITVTCDGKTFEHYVLDKTVAETLKELKITLTADDEISMSLDTVLKPDDNLTVYRVRYELREVTETIPWEEVEKPSPLIGDGKRQVMNAGAGRDGEAIRVYRDKYMDGELVETTLDSEKITTVPRNVVTLVGQSDAVMSAVDGTQFCDIEIVDNAPVEYYDVITEGVCTAYSFPPGTYGASGMHLFQGFVAVNNEVIPFGTLLYITSPSGKFVYGWAIAADIGTAMMEGRVDIDCFFETYTESALFGRKYLNIYMVKQLTQAELEQYSAVAGMFNNRVPSQ